MGFNTGINTGVVVGVTTGVATGMAMGNSLRSSSSGESIGKQLYSILNMEFEYEQKRRKEERNEKKKNREELSLKLEEEVFKNEEISEEAKSKISLLNRYLGVFEFYLPSADNLVETYSRLRDEYKSKYYGFQGTYRRVAWSGDILSKDEVEELNSKIETLNEEVESLGVDLDNIGYMRMKVERGQIAEIDFSKYSKHIRPEIVKLICPEAQMYLKQILRESWTDIYRCIREAESCLREARCTLEKNQENIEKTFKYKVLNLFKKK